MSEGNEPELKEARIPRVSIWPPSAKATGDLRELLRHASPTTSIEAANVERAILEVKVGERTELVTLFVEGGRLRVLTSNGAGAESALAQAALAWLQGASAERAREPAAERNTPVRTGHDPGALADRLADLRIAIVRSGVDVGDPASVREAMPRVVAELPSPLPSAVARWLGRLTLSLSHCDAHSVARLLEGTIPRGPGNALGLPFVVAERPVSDRLFVEIAREHVDSFELAPIERRVLVDPETGELFTESRPSDKTGASLYASMGPCPRVLEVGLGTLREGVPRELRAQQYTLRSGVTQELWDRVESHATPVAAALEVALTSFAEHPAAAEPLSLILGPTLEDEVLHDAEGTRIPIVREDPGAAEALMELAHETPLRWLLVRWVAREAGIGAVPLATAHRDGPTWRHVRLR